MKSKRHWTLAGLLLAGQSALAGEPVGITVGQTVSAVIGTVVPIDLGGTLPVGIGGVAAITGLSLIIGVQLVRRRSK